MMETRVEHVHAGKNPSHWYVWVCVCAYAFVYVYVCYQKPIWAARLMHIFRFPIHIHIYTGLQRAVFVECDPCYYYIRIFLDCVYRRRMQKRALGVSHT